MSLSSIRQHERYMRCFSFDGLDVNVPELKDRCAMPHGFVMASTQLAGPLRLPAARRP